MKQPKQRPPANSLEAFVARGEENGAKHDAAILQSLREHVWQALSSGGDPAELSKIIALIIAARRQDLAEKNASRDGQHGVLEWFEQNVEPELRAAADSNSNQLAL